VLLVTGLVTVAGYALVQSLQTPQQTIGKAVQQTAERVLVLNISVDSAEFAPGSTIRTSPQRYRQEQGNQRDPTGVLLIAPLHLRLIPGGNRTETMGILLVYSRGAKKGKPLPPGNYTLTVYLTAAVQGQPSGIIDGVKAYTAKSVELTVNPPR